MYLLSNGVIKDRRTFKLYLDVEFATREENDFTWF